MTKDSQGTNYNLMVTLTCPKCKEDTSFDFYYGFSYRCKCGYDFISRIILKDEDKEAHDD